MMTLARVCYLQMTRAAVQVVELLQLPQQLLLRVGGWLVPIPHLFSLVPRGMCVEARSSMPRLTA